MTVPSFLQDYVGREEIAAAFKVSPRTISRWSNQADGMPYVVVGNRTLYRLAAVENWLRSRERTPNLRRKST
jgi:phage terminase Nu1 subunit (DNA packaging protein)